MYFLQQLTAEVSTARQSFLSAVSSVTEEQAAFKFEENEWSINQNAEHLFWAEFGGINGMWKAFHRLKAGNPTYTGERVHHGLSIEAIIALTWKEKEQVPEIAKPKWGGPIQSWINALSSCQPMLEGLVSEIQQSGLNPQDIIHPHPISGPLNIVQRLQFLRFHINRHLQQVENIKSHSLFPKESFA
jgi:hypothetical protein